jgi:8-oxo-dGTP diphosphatase
MPKFTGSKIVLLHRGQLLAYQRDRKPEIPYPGMWDLPGGGREADESPSECAIRETWEEFGVRVDQESIVWEKHYPAPNPTDLGSYFLVADFPDGFGEVSFGEEGQQWRIMAVEDFLDHPEVVNQLKMRLRHYLAENPRALFDRK